MSIHWQVHEITRDWDCPSKASLTAGELREINALALETGFHEVHLLETSKIVVAHWVGLKCRYGCANYNNSWCCPPATPSLEKTKELLSEYELALLLVGERTNEHFYRNNRLKRRGQIKQWKATVSLERKLFLKGYYKAFGLPGESCALCKTCSYPDNCLFPIEKRPSIEACSIDIFKTLEGLGRRIHLAKGITESYLTYSLILLQ